MRDSNSLGLRATAISGLGTTLLSQVLLLLSVSFICTAGGAVLGIAWGAPAFIPALIVTFVCVIALQLARNIAPLNLGLLYLFATCEGVILGLILQSYVQAGYGNIAIDAAGTTAVLTLAAGAYGLRTQRNLTGLGPLLSLGLIGLIVTIVLGLFLNLSGISLIFSLCGAALFCGFLVYDFNRIAQRPVASQGDAILFTVSIYLDIINLFLFVLRILSLFSGGGLRRR